MRQNHRCDEKGGLENERCENIFATDCLLKSFFAPQISEPGSVRVTHDADEDGEGVLAASRPSTRNTIKDGIVIRWDTDQKPMLRRPRTSGSTHPTLYSTCVYK